MIGLITQTWETETGKCLKKKKKKSIARIYFKRKSNKTKIWKDTNRNNNWSKKLSVIIKKKTKKEEK